MHIRPFVVLVVATFLLFAGGGSDNCCHPHVDPNPPVDRGPPLDRGPPVDPGPPIDRVPPVDPGPPVDRGRPFDPDPFAALRLITSEADLIGGSPVARGRVGDYLMENDRIRVIIRQAGRNWYGGINPYGGTIVDADIQRPPGEPGRSHFEASLLGVNISTVPNYQDIRILNDGSDGEAAVLRATGPVDLIEYINPSSQVEAAGLPFPESADDVPLPIEVRTDYILEPGNDYVIERTTLFNRQGEDLDIYLAEIMNASGEVDAFMPRKGFGEPLGVRSCPMDLRVDCAEGSCDPCNLVAFAGYDRARDIAYGRIHGFFGSSNFNQTGVNTIVYGLDVLALFFFELPPNFTIPGHGEMQFDRYFAVTSGSVSNIQKVRNEIFGFDIGRLRGVVRSGGQPVVDAEVAVTRDDEDLAFNVVSQDVTDADGSYGFDLPPGDYEVRVHKDGREFGTPHPAENVTVSVGASAEQDFDLPSAGFLSVTVNDQSGRPLPAKVQLVGFDPSPPLTNVDTGALGDFLGQAGVFFDHLVRDPLPFGVSFVDFIGPSGTLPQREVEPGEYQLVVSRGPRYSAYRENVTITEGGVQAVHATLTRVVDTPGFISADFHVHGIDSLDSRIPREDRVLTYLAEGVDFFTPSDHGIQVDFQPRIDAIPGASRLIGTATSAELTTPDYGHFNTWPRTVVAELLSGGSTDWGWKDVPAGQRFPALGNFLLSPGDLIAAASQDVPGGFDPIVQVNHIHSFFGPTGLGIDTGVIPPASTVDPERRRLDPTIDNHFADNFDALEIWIGVNHRRGIGERLNENMADWFNLINQGIVRTAVASSDSHERRLTSMSTRSMVASAVTDPSRLSDHAQILADTVAEGKVTMTNGPFVTITAADGLGQTAGLGIEDERTLTNVHGDAQVELTIASPAWAEFDKVEFFINNAPERKDDTATPRYTICADETLREADGDFELDTVETGDSGATRLEATVTLTLEDLSEDTWIVARVSGTDGVSEPLFPVEPADLVPAGKDTREDLTGSLVGEGGVMAMAITNPLFIATGDTWEAPGVSRGECNTEE